MLQYLVAWNARTLGQMKHRAPAGRPLLRFEAASLSFSPLRGHFKA